MLLRAAYERAAVAPIRSRYSRADVISFGRAFLANPDLVERLRDGLPIAPVDEATYYQGGDAGYLTYSAHQYSA